MNKKGIITPLPKRLSIPFLAALLFLTPAGLRGQEKISLATSVDRSTITIGDLITYSVTVSRDPEVQVQMPSLGENLGGFEIRDYTVHDPQKQAGRILDRVDYIISTFEVGEFEIPPIKISYTLPGENEKNSLKTESIKIVVESVKPSEEGDIREIRPPWEIPYNWKPVFMLGGIVFLGLLAGVVLIWVVRKRRRGEALLPRKAIPPRPPHEVAYEELQRLVESNLLTKGNHKKYYSKISEIIRRYVEGRFQIIALELTSTELLDELRTVPLAEKHLALFGQFLNLCDLVKFAKHLPGTQEDEMATRTALQIVDETKEKVEKEEESYPEEKKEEENATPASQKEFPVNGEKD